MSDGVSTGWDAGTGYMWMARNCEQCALGGKDCVLELSLWIGTVPRDLAGYGLSYRRDEDKSSTLRPDGGWDVRYGGTWHETVKVPDDCPRRVPRARRTCLAWSTTDEGGEPYDA